MTGELDLQTLLPRVSLSDARALTRLARSIDARSTSSFLDAARKSLDATIEIVARHLELGSFATPAEPLAAVLLRRGSEPAAPRLGLAVELDPSWAVAIVEHALGGELASDHPDSVCALSDAERGVLACVAATVLSNLEALDWKIATVVTTTEALHAHVPPTCCAVLRYELTWRNRPTWARMWLPLHGSMASGDALQAADSAIARHTPLALRAYVGTSSLALGDFAALEPGDVVILDDPSVRAGADGFVGEAWVRVDGSADTTWNCALEPEGLRIQRIETLPVAPPTEGRRMDDSTQAEPATPLGNNARVELAVEVARFQITLAELAALRPGELMATGTPLGMSVTLRAAGRAVATGELVNVDGEIGVRILALTQVDQ